MIAVSTFHVSSFALYNCLDIQGGKFAGISTSRNLKLCLALGACNFTTDATRSLNSVQAVKTETVQTWQLLWISECTLANKTANFMLNIVHQGLYIHGKGVGNKTSFRDAVGLLLTTKLWLYERTIRPSLEAQTKFMTDQSKRFSRHVLTTKTPVL